jgi:hypothetical protein
MVTNRSIRFKVRSGQKAVNLGHSQRTALLTGCLLRQDEPIPPNLPQTRRPIFFQAFGLDLVRREEQM